VDHKIRLREPVVTDGAAVTALIEACPPLDRNSAYCNLLQCTHFADSCVIAERAGRVVGWVSGYRPPSEPADFFIWQVAVAAEARGKGLARQMIEALLERSAVRGVTHVITTITPGNASSWGLFEGLASRWAVPLAKSEHFQRVPHFGGAHDTEWLVRIGPLPNRSQRNKKQEIQQS